jgi:HK97 family phage prohead protease
MKTKIFSAPLEVKADEGNAHTFEAIFARFNVIDHDGDVVLPTAIEDGAKVRISYWGHRWQDLPIGRGVITVDEEKAKVSGVFFDTEGGRETYETLKGLNDLAEFSYGFDVLEAERGTFRNEDVQFLKKLKLFEVSPVMLGATPDTALLAIKSMKNDDIGDGDEGEIEDDKPSEPDANLMTEITIVEIGVIALGGLSNEKE